MLEKRQKIHEEELFGVRVLFLDILNLKGQWSIQVWKKLLDSEQTRYKSEQWYKGANYFFFITIVLNLDNMA